MLHPDTVSASRAPAYGSPLALGVCTEPQSNVNGKGSLQGIYSDALLRAGTTQEAAQSVERLGTALAGDMEGISLTPADVTRGHSSPSCC